LNISPYRHADNGFVAHLNLHRIVSPQGIKSAEALNLPFTFIPYTILHLLQLKWQRKGGFTPVLELPVPILDADSK
jgi:hypothetical protein